ncbi:hypothetical protein MINTM006_52370 [Mycobacterium intracellulare]|nr:hypothetical protein MINTM006_52370 [Mycobacterium intracellulare]BCP23543.1 hypothetical protein MINTM023_53320 [Mycobacterium intracellulare]BCP34550.1 hypothetical protein MINTM026_55200 [Mycobacterium intracellulare]
MYVLTVTNFGDTCSGRADTVSAHKTYEAACAAAGGSAAVDHLTVTTRHCSTMGGEVMTANGLFIDDDGVALFGFRISRES